MWVVCWLVLGGCLSVCYVVRIFVFHDKIVWPIDLHMKHMIFSSVKNILNWVLLLMMVINMGSFIVSSRFMNIWRRKLRLCSYLSKLIPALMWFIWGTRVIFILLNVLMIVWFGIHWYTFDMISFFLLGWWVYALVLGVSLSS